MKTRFIVACASDARQKVLRLVEPHLSKAAVREGVARIVGVDVKRRAGRKPRALTPKGIAQLKRFAEAMTSREDGLRRGVLVALAVDVLSVGREVDVDIEQIDTPDGAAGILKDLVRKHRVDAVSYGVERLKNFWLHGELGEERVGEWLRQFDRLGPHGWIGQRLLDVLDIWYADRVIDALGLKNAATDGSCWCFNLATKGKSSGILSSLARKQGIEDPMDLSAALEEDRDDRLVYAEDGLFSGFEAKAMILSLLGQQEPGRKPKAPPLSKPEQLRARTVEMRYAVRTSLGEMILREFLAERNLANIAVSESGHRIEVLTARGYRALANRALLVDRLIQDQDGTVVAQVFDRKLWGTRTTEGRNFCSAVGRQLWAHYAKERRWPLSQAEIDQSALGTFGQGLGVAFPYTIPKATLPLFWIGGEVALGGKVVSWIPLFPSAVS